MVSKSSQNRLNTVVESEELPLFRQAREKSISEAGPKPSHKHSGRISSGLQSLDGVLGGGFRVGKISIIASRAKMGATSLLVGACLANLKARHPVAYFSQRLKSSQIKGRLVVLESRVNGHLIAAGLASDKDHLALQNARERLPWTLFRVHAAQRITLERVDAELFNYRANMAVIDFTPTIDSDLVKGLHKLRSIAHSHSVALIVRLRLPRGEHEPDILELPDLGACLETCDSALLLHRHGTGRETGGGSDKASIDIVCSHERSGSPKRLWVDFDHRYAGLSDLHTRSP
jgi:replicative DNA helicase